MQRFATVLMLSALFLPALGTEGSAQQVRAERLLGGNENPPVISEGFGRFRAELLDDRISFRLRYDLGPEASEVVQAHLHIANPGTNGDVVAFLCANEPIVPPEGTPECPPSPGEVEGEIFALDVLPIPRDSGALIAAEDLEGLQRLIDQGSVYANVHTVDHASGEIRGQLEPRRR
jgi:CHRD domain